VTSLTGSSSDKARQLALSRPSWFAGRHKVHRTVRARRSHQIDGCPQVHGRGWIGFQVGRHIEIRKWLARRARRDRLRGQRTKSHSVRCLRPRRVGW